MPEIPDGWFPVVTLVVGYAMKVLGDLLQHHLSATRERDAREASRKEQRAERRATFQRQTLLDLQDAALQVARAAGEMHHHDVISLRRTGKWQKELYGEAVSESARLANARTAMLVVRVRDDAVREITGEFKTCAADASRCHSEEEAQRHLAGMGNQFQKLNQRIGELLRTLDDEET